MLVTAEVVYLQLGKLNYLLGLSFCFFANFAAVANDCQTKNNNLDTM